MPAHLGGSRDGHGYRLAGPGAEYFDGDRGQALLYEAIATLPGVQRTVFNLRYFDEMKYSEISKVLDTSEGALKASYHIAVQKISEYVKRKS